MPKDVVEAVIQGSVENETDHDSDIPGDIYQNILDMIKEAKDNTIIRRTLQTSVANMLEGDCSEQAQNCLIQIKDQFGISEVWGTH